VYHVRPLVPDSLGSRPEKPPFPELSVRALRGYSFDPDPCNPLGWRLAIPTQRERDDIMAR
jgi:hypothetical protein